MYNASASFFNFFFFKMKIRYAILSVTLYDYVKYIPYSLHVVLNVKTKQFN